MNIEKDIEKLIAEGENLHVEFKTSFNDGLVETVVALSNTNGVSPSF